jgi:hypothetical protein
MFFVIRFFLIILLVFNPVQACLCGADTFGFSSANIGPSAGVFTIPAYTLEKNKIVLGTSMRFTNSYEFSASKLQELNDRDAHSHSMNSQMNLSFNTALGLTDDLTLFAALPYNMRYGIRATHDGMDYSGGDSIGFGDLSLLAKYRVINSCSKDYQVAILGGIKMPTGQTNETDEFGFRLSADEQPGSGSWDPMMGFAISKVFDQYSIDASALYTLSTPGSEDVIVGDRVNFGLALNKKIKSAKIAGHNLDLVYSLESFGIWQEKFEYQGLKDDNHGAFQAFLGTGLKLGLDDNTFMNFNVAYPIIDLQNGDQPDTGVILQTGINFLI